MSWAAYSLVARSVLFDAFVRWRRLVARWTLLRQRRCAATGLGSDRFTSGSKQILFMSLRCHDVKTTR
jgi:hypothetical protein